MFFADLLSSGSDLRTVSDGRGWSHYIGRSHNSSGVRVTAETALALPVLQNCVTLLAETLAQLPLDLYQRKGHGQREAATAHPLHDVLKYQPNPVHTPYDRMELCQTSAGLRGNGYEFIERRGDGNVAALWPLDANKVTVYKGSDLLPYYDVGAPDRLPMNMVHHVRWISHNGYVGLSPILLHAEAVGLAHAVRQYTGKSFANGVAIGGVLERPKEVAAIKDQPSIDRILEDWHAKHSGIDNTRKVALLQEGMTFKPISMNNVDADIVNILKVSGADIARIYKIPLPMVNDLEKASYNSIEQLLIHFVMFAVLPWCKRHEQAMMRDFLLPKDRSDYFIEFNLSGLLRGDQKSRFESYAIGRQWGWLSVNDIRRLENLPPIEGGEVYLQPLNMVDSTRSTPDLNNPQVRTQLELQQHEIERLLQP